VLSATDGEGRNSVWLAPQGLQVNAFDLSDVGVAKALAFAADRGVTVRYAVADVDRPAWPEALDDSVAGACPEFCVRGIA
jgi:2-polyprenyl-3-methyl-5-hydroxy-6-metoxy-1,4-benzoquinol methylase